MTRSEKDSKSSSRLLNEDVNWGDNVEFYNLCIDRFFKLPDTFLLNDDKKRAEVSALFLW